MKNNPGNYVENPEDDYIDWLIASEEIEELEIANAEAFDEPDEPKTKPRSKRGFIFIQRRLTRLVF